MPKDKKEKKERATPLVEKKEKPKSAYTTVSDAKRAVIQIILSPKFSYWNAHLTPEALKKLLEAARKGTLEVTDFPASIPVLAPYAPAKGKAMDTQVYCQVKFDNAKRYVHRVVAQWAHGLPPQADSEASHAYQLNRQVTRDINPNNIYWESSRENQGRKGKQVNSLAVCVINACAVLYARAFMAVIIHGRQYAEEKEWEQNAEKHYYQWMAAKATWTDRQRKLSRNAHSEGIKAFKVACNVLHAGKSCKFLFPDITFPPEEE